MKTREILVAARELISQPERWTKGEYARDLNGRRVSPGGPNAVCWCSIGAMAKVAGLSSGEMEASEASVTLALAAESNGVIPEWNDASGHQSVVEAFDRAIAQCEVAP